MTSTNREGHCDLELCVVVWGADQGAGDTAWILRAFYSLCEGLQIVKVCVLFTYTWKVLYRLGHQLIQSPQRPPQCIVETMTREGSLGLTVSPAGVWFWKKGQVYRMWTLSWSLKPTVVHYFIWVLQIIFGSCYWGVTNYFWKKVRGGGFNKKRYCWFELMSNN